MPARPRDVFIVANNTEELGGLQRVAHALADGLARRGHRVRLIGITHAEQVHDYRPADAAYDTSVVYDEPNPPGFGVRKPRGSWDLKGRLRERVRRQRFAAGVKRLTEVFASVDDGIIICTQIWAMQWVAKAETLHLHVIGQSHESFEASAGLTAATGGSLRYKRIQQFYPSVDRFLLLTAADAVKFRDVGFTNTGVMHNPVAMWPTTLATLDAKTVVAVGRYAEQKNYAQLIDAFATVHERHPDWQLEIYGEGPLQSQLEQQIRSLGLTASARLMGPTTDVESALLASSVFALSSDFEGLPLVLVEAMACGVPCVAYDCSPGIREIVTDGVDGLVVPPGNPAALAEGIVRLIEDAELRRVMGARGRESVRRFSTDAIMQQWEDLFAQVERGADGVELIAPGNAGLAQARAPYVLFIDDTDTLDRHAAANLLAAVENTGADVVIGAADDDYVGLANKLFRRDFLDGAGLRYADGLEFADRLFAVEALAAATQVTTIPERVVSSMPRDVGNEPIERFHDLVAVCKAADGELDRHLLAQELHRYLTTLWRRDEAYQQEWLAAASAYLRALPESTLDAVGRDARLAAWAVRSGDLEVALAAADLWIRGTVGRSLVQRDGRTYFADIGLDTPLGRRAMDVSALHVDGAPFAHADVHHRAVSVTAGPALELRGETINQLGRLGDSEAADFTIVLSAPGSDTVVLPVTQTVIDGPRISWAARIDADALVPRRSKTEWRVSVRVQNDDQANTNPLRGASPGTVFEVGGGSLTAHVTASGTVALSDHRPRVPQPFRRRLKNRFLRTGAARQLRTRRAKSLAYRSVLRRLPLRAETVVFESHLGRQYSDSPKYVYEELRRIDPSRRAVWSHSGPKGQWPKDAVRVRRDSWRYYVELARAGTWVDNQGFPAIVAKRRGQRYVQTWHGTPLKHMGHDEPQFAFGSVSRRETFQAQIDRWNAFSVTSQWSADRFAHAFRLASHTDILRTGYPRNDLLFRATDADYVAGIRRRLGLPTDRKIVLYAPTFRDYRKQLGQPPSVALDLPLLDEAVSEDWFLVVRMHYLEKVNLQGRQRFFVRDMSAHHDVSEILLAADALITDYSSVMFDYALTRRPMAFFVYDYDLYASHRGTYFDLRDEAPGPAVRTTAEIVKWLQEQPADIDPRYDAFLAKFCEYERGDAAAQTVRWINGEGRADER